MKILKTVLWEDVEALYSSIDIDFATEKCCELLHDSDVVFENVDWEELGLYISLTSTMKELSDYNDFCPTRKFKRGRKPTITASGTESKHEKR